MHDVNGVLELLLPDGSNVPWGVHYSYGEKLLVREEYKRAYNEIIKNTNLKMAYLSGTHGIGKTMFLVWLIYKLVSSRAEGSPILISQIYNPYRSIELTYTTYFCLFL